MPSARNMWYCSAGVTLSATWIMPSFSECAMIPAIVYRCVLCGSASWYQAPCHLIASGTTKLVLGFSPAYWKAAAAVITLAVLPGSNTFDSAMSFVAATLAGATGLNVGYCASARILPVPGCITTTVQFLALVLATCRAHSCSAFHWMSAWMVSRRLPAGNASLTVDSVPGMGSPFAPCS